MAHAPAGLEAHWARRDALSTLLLPLALLFASLGAARRAAYALGLAPSARMPVPVIVVGNIMVGGTGKTPLVQAIVELLRAHGHAPGIVSRGYGGSYALTGPPVQLVTSDDAGIFGDEVALLYARSHAPIAVGARRADAARTLLAAHPALSVIVCDDGLQHYALARDIELVVFDERGCGNGRLLPAGPLREPLARAAAASALVINGAAPAPEELAGRLPQFAMKLEATDAYRLVDPGERRALPQVPGPRRLAAAGIGNPARFFAMLAGAGVDAETLALPDHFDYRDNPFADRTADAILITEKDAVKCRHLKDARLWVVPVEARLDGAFEPFLTGLLRAQPNDRSTSA